jgi:kumamolisin
MKARWLLKARAAGLISILIALPPAIPAAQASSGAAAGRRVLADSIRPVSDRGSSARIVRSSLTADELAQPMAVSVSLQMPNFPELQARLAMGQSVANGRIGSGEMEARYLPSPADYSAVRSWLISQGFGIVEEDGNHTTIFARATVAQVAASFQASFARVQTADGEFTSAVSVPSVPAELPASILGIDGLQPYVRAHHPPGAAPATVAGSNGFLFIGPSDVRSAYGVPADLTGNGQTIAVVMSADVSNSDLTTFWSTAGVAQSTANVTTIPINGGPDASEQSALGLEVSIDMDWASATAPGAKVRLYATSDLLFSTVNQAAVQILQDAKTIPGLTVVSMSVCGPENQSPVSSYAAYSQTFAQLGAAGISVLACSGDGGSNPNPDLTNQYSPTFPLTVEYPASDPNVTGVGGTNMSFTSSWTYASEDVWSTISGNDSATNNMEMASGGGVSGFARPSWQAGGGSALAANPGQRLVPDVSALSMGTTLSTSPAGTTYAVICYQGMIEGCYGTSLATPIWAGIIAMVNQGRAANGLGPVGPLGPALYPLAGTSAFTDITSGSNGMYTAGAGYDLCTGLGSPNVSALVKALGGAAAESGPPPAGTVTQAAPGALGAGATLTLSASGSGAGIITYLWNLDGTAIRGATNSTYSITAGAEDAGTYSVTLSNAGGSTTLAAGTVAVTTDAWLSNLSARALVEPAPNLLIAGFATTGSAEKSILVRGAGPALLAFGLTNYLPNPQLALQDSTGATFATNMAWKASLEPLFTALNAFAFASGSPDTALEETLAPSSYTAQVSTPSQDGVAIAEVYDADGTAPSDRLVNLSARAFVGSGGNILIGGFVITGTTSETVIIRGIGPSLAAFGVTGVLSNPVLTVYDANQNQIAQNTGWGSSVVSGSTAAENATAAIFSSVHAFALAAGTADSAMVITLAPGSYTAQLSGAAGSTAPTGVGLVEIYELR